MSDLWFEVGEFGRRWWKVGLPVVVLAIVIPVGLVAGGGGDEEATEAASAESPTTPDESTIGSSPEQKDDSRQEQQDDSRQGENARGRNGGTRSGSSGNRGAAAEGPVSPYGPPGSPVGEVPPGAPVSADARAVALTLSTFLKAISRGDGPQACAQLSPEGRERVEREVHQAAPETGGTPCEGAIVLYQGGGRNPRITDVRVAGDQATAKGPPHGRRGDLGKRENVWLIDNYGWG